MGGMSWGGGGRPRAGHQTIVVSNPSENPSFEKQCPLSKLSVNNPRPKVKSRDRSIGLGKEALWF